MVDFFDSICVYFNVSRGECWNGYIRILRILYEDSKNRKYYTSIKDTTGRLIFLFMAVAASITLSMDVDDIVRTDSDRLRVAFH